MSRVRSVVMYRPIAENALKGNEIPINHHKIFLNKAKDHFKKGLSIPIWPLSLESKYFMLPLSASKIEIGLDFLPKSLKTLPSLKSLERLKLEKLEMAKAWVLTKKISLGAWSLTRLVETILLRRRNPIPKKERFSVGDRRWDEHSGGGGNGEWLMLSKEERQRRRVRLTNLGHVIAGCFLTLWKDWKNFT